MMLDLVLARINEGESLNVVRNAGHLLVSMIQKGSESANWEDLIGHLTTGSCVTRLFTNLFAGAGVIMKTKMSVLKALVDSTSLKLGMWAEGTEAEDNLLVLLMKNKDNIEEFLKTAAGGSVKSTFGAEISPVGESKLGLIELLTACLRVSCGDFQKSIAESSVLEAITVRVI